MTIEQIQGWSSEEKRAVIAAACGLEPWLRCHTHSEVPRDRAIRGETGSLYCPLCKCELTHENNPDYPNDLNAMHGAEQRLKRDMNGLWYPYCAFLQEFAHGLGEGASAEQRADAFIVVVSASLVPSEIAAARSLCRSIKRAVIRALSRKQNNPSVGR